MTTTALIVLLDGWVRDAVARHGDDWPAIMAALEENMERLGGEQRTELSSQIALLLASCPKRLDSGIH
jgi:hypothetical protein